MEKKKNKIKIELAGTPTVGSKGVNIMLMKAFLLYKCKYINVLYISYSDRLIENWSVEEAYHLALYYNVNLIGFGGHECTGPLQPKPSALSCPPKPIKLALSIG